MNATTKKILYGAALLVSSAMFAHEVVRATRSENAALPVLAERAADDASSSERPPSHEPAAPAVSTTSTDDHGAPPSASATSGEPAEALAKLEEALVRLETASRPRASRRLESMARARRGMESQALETETPVELATAQPEPNETEPSVRDEAERRARVTLWVEEHPLAGVVCGSSGATALFGGRIVRTGEALPGGDAVVESIDARGATLRIGAARLRVELSNVEFRRTTRLPAEQPATDAPQSAGGQP